MVPLQKRKSRHGFQYYRGIHMTYHISKVLERYVALIIEPHAPRFNLFGERQWGLPAP